MEQVPFFKTGQEIILEKDSKPTKSKLRGWKVGHYLLVDTPDISWTSTQSTSIIGRFLRGAAYYGFSTEALGLFREVNLLALRYPDDIVETSPRKHLRFDTTIPVEIVNKNGSEDKNITGVITNISESGCQLVLAEQRDVDEKLYLRIHFPTGSRIEKMGCILRNVTKVNDKFNCGVLFDIIDDDELIPLKEFINTVSQYNIQNYGQ